MNLDLTDDFATLDNLEPLTLRVAGLPLASIPRALSEPAQWKDPDEAGGNVLEGDQLWIWPIPATPVRPPLGSLLIDGNGTAWTILSLTRKDHLNVWEAHGRALSIVYNLNNFAQVLKAAWTKSPGGEAKPTWQTILAAIPARFQPVHQDAQILEDAEWPKTTYHVFLGTDIFDPQIPVEPASADYRLVDTAGRHYRIVSYQRPERIDTLPMAVCVLIIEGSEGTAADRLANDPPTHPIPVPRHRPPRPRLRARRLLRRPRPRCPMGWRHTHVSPARRRLRRDHRRPTVPMPRQVCRPEYVTRTHTRR